METIARVLLMLSRQRKQGNCINPMRFFEWAQAQKVRGIDLGEEPFSAFPLWEIAEGNVLSLNFLYLTYE
jgi:hypothetical protein